MKSGFLTLLGVLPISVLTRLVVPADVAPPGALLVLSLGVIIVLGLLVAVIVLVSFLVIRAIKKKNRTPKDDA